MLMQDPVVKAIADRLPRSPAQVRLFPALPCPALLFLALASFCASTLSLCC